MIGVTQLESAMSITITDPALLAQLAGTSGAIEIGFSRNSSVNRTAIDLPLGIDYEIIEDDKLVRVLRVWSLV